MWDKNDRLLVVIDAANLEKSAQSLRMKVHYTRLKRFFENHGRLKGIRFYTAAFGTIHHQNFLESLKRKNYTLITKPVKEIINKNFMEKVRKANFDVEITMDVMDLMNEFDALILFSGDSDFDCLVQRVRSKSKRVFIFSTQYHVSRELIRGCNRYFDIRDYREDLLKPVKK